MLFTFNFAAIVNLLAVCRNKLVSRVKLFSEKSYTPGGTAQLLKPQGQLFHQNVISSHGTPAILRTFQSL